MRQVGRIEERNLPFERAARASDEHVVPENAEPLRDEMSPWLRPQAHPAAQQTDAEACAADTAIEQRVM